MRRLLAANWKMHLYAEQALTLTQQLRAAWEAPELRTLPGIVFPPALYLRELAMQLAGSSIALGAQNGYPGEFGAFTGEISMAQLAAAGATWVLVGHSERRQYFGENAELLRKKVQDAQARSLSVLYCVGETLAEREAGRTLFRLQTQLQEVLSENIIDWNRLAIAYEPVWAIGTGINATPDQAQEAHAYLRMQLAQLGAPADQIPILYGGSLKPDNAYALFSQPDIDGGLVGGASLSADSFLAIAQAHLQTKPL